MKTAIILFFSIVFSTVAFSQSDWELPVVNDKIQFEFNSKKLKSGNKDLCELYTSLNLSQDLNNELRTAMLNGKVKFFTATNFTLLPVLYRADFSMGGNDVANISKPVCGQGSDTLIGSIQITITQTNALRNSRSGIIKCLYRIILEDDSYNIKFRGFKFTTYSKAGAETRALEEDYNSNKVKQSDKKFWADIKMLVNLYADKLEKVMSAQGFDYNFDD